MNKSQTDAGGTLARQVARRREFLTLIADPIEQILREVGLRVRYHQGSGHTNSAYHFGPFENFFFKGDFGHTQFGGNIIEVYFDEHCPLSPNDATKKVLEVYWQVDIENCQVRTFDPGPRWQERLRSIATKPKDFCQRHRVALQKLKGKSLQASQKIQRAARLLDEARRLGITVE